MHSSTTITQQQAQQIAPNKKALYELLACNQHILPLLREQMVTVKYLMGILNKKYWSLESGNSKPVKVVARPPSKKKLADIVSQLLHERAMSDVENASALQATAELVESKPPSPQWMIQVISTLKEDHEIFNKDYRPPRVDRAGDLAPVPLIEDPMNLFANMPVSVFRSKRCLNYLDPAVRQQIKMDQLNARLIKLQGMVDKQQQAMQLPAHALAQNASMHSNSSQQPQPQLQAQVQSQSQPVRNTALPVQNPSGMNMNNGFNLSAQPQTVINTLHQMNAGQVADGVSSHPSQHPNQHQSSASRSFPPIGRSQNDADENMQEPVVGGNIISNQDDVELREAMLEEEAEAQRRADFARQQAEAEQAALDEYREIEFMRENEGYQLAAQQQDERAFEQRMFAGFSQQPAIMHPSFAAVESQSQPDSRVRTFGDDIGNSNDAMSNNIFRHATQIRTKKTIQNKNKNKTAGSDKMKAVHQRHRNQQERNNAYYANEAVKTTASLFGHLSMSQK